MRRRVGFIGMAFMAFGLSGCVAPQSDLSAIPQMPSSVAVDRGGARVPGHPGLDARAPSGYLAFCDRNPDECRAHPGQPDRVRFTRALWDEMEKVNLVVNATVHPEDDKQHYGVTEFWTVPVDGQGDCEDYVLAKRKMLVLLGLPEAALRITVVLDRGIVRHAVLTVVTDRGDYVLDSLKDEILTTDKADYVWVERQDAASRTGWVTLR
jgi:predicted transglutaminase-like cysteine proteinase